MSTDPFINRIKNKARANQLCIAIGSEFSSGLDLPTIALKICEEFNLSFSIRHRNEWYSKWNEFVDFVEKKINREKINGFVRDLKAASSPKKIHRMIASIPISNFIDVSMDRQLISALIEIGKSVVTYNFSSMHIGSWRQRNPENPTVFNAFADLENISHWHGLHQQFTFHPQDRIQIENMMEMIRQKDLLILGISPHEAEAILHLSYLSQAADKVVSSNEPTKNYQYWAKRGVYVSDMQSDAIINELLPFDMKSYSKWDKPFGRRLIDVVKVKRHDAFISYFSGDKAFSRKIEGDLQNRGLVIWRDEEGIEIGDSITDKIQEALKDSYTFIIVLSPDAIERPWVKEELRAAYNLRLADELKILPVVYKDCEIPLFLTDYRYADFREEKNYTEQMGFLSKAINNAVMRARKKK